MEQLVLKAKAWQVFLVLLASYFISWFVKDEEVSGILKLVGFSIFCVWLALIGNTMNQLDKAVEKPGVSWFIINIAVTIELVRINYQDLRVRVRGKPGVGCGRAGYAARRPPP